MGYEGILKHPWINGTANSKAIPNIISNIKAYTAKSRFKRVNNIIIGARGFMNAGKHKK